MMFEKQEVKIGLLKNNVTAIKRKEDLGQKSTCLGRFGLLGRHLGGATGKPPTPIRKSAPAPLPPPCPNGLKIACVGCRLEGDGGEYRCSYEGIM
jgi:hypothetical protein